MLFLLVVILNLVQMVCGYSLEDMSSGSLRKIIMDKYPNNKRAEDKERCYKYVVIQRDKDKDFEPRNYYSENFSVQAKNYRQDELRLRLAHHESEDIVKHTMRKIKEVEEITFVNMTISDNLLNIVIQSGIKLSTVSKLHFKSCTVTASSTNLSFFLWECNLETLEMSNTPVRCPGPIHYWLPSPSCSLIATNVTGEELFPDEMLEQYLDNPVGILQLNKTNTDFTVTSIFGLIMKCKKEKRICSMNFGQIQRNRFDIEVITAAQKLPGISWKTEREREFDTYEIKLLSATFYFCLPV